MHPNNIFLNLQDKQTTMKKLTALILATLFYVNASSQCLPEGIDFTTQSEIDSFQVNYPGCTDILGSVTVNGIGINNLLGLSILTNIGGSFTIYYNDDLINILGVENITSIGGSLSINENHYLQTIGGFENLTTVDSNVTIYNNFHLEYFNTFENLTLIGGFLTIGNNGDLINLSGLENLTSIGGDLGIFHNWDLQNLNGLESLNHVAGEVGVLHNYDLINLIGLDSITSIEGGIRIDDNWSLISLEGIDNIDSDLIDYLYITGNSLLCDCAVESICGFFDGPHGNYSLNFNLQGCNTKEEVEEACETVSINEVTLSAQLSIYPNPFTTSTTFEYTLQQPSSVQISIFNHLGNQVAEIRKEQSEGKQQVIWNAEQLPSGVYFYRLQAGEQAASGKILLVK